MHQFIIKTMGGFWGPFKHAEDAADWASHHLADSSWSIWKLRTVYDTQGLPDQ